MINVENGKIVGWVGEGFVYVGRYCNGMKGSYLANKYKIGRDGDSFQDAYRRTEVIAKYRTWLWEIVQRKNSKAWNELCELVNRYKDGENISLICWCKPLGCHADVLKNCIEYLSKY